MTRVIAAWRNLEPDGRPAVLAAVGLFVSMLLPWYSKSDTVVVERASRAGHAAAVSSETSLNAFQAFSFVEAAVLLTSGAVVFLLFKRADGASFRMPGGDGTVVMAAGGWAALLVFYRLLDKPGLQGNQQVTATVGVEWGIFVTLLTAIGLAYCGRRMRAAAMPEPPARRRAQRQESPLVRREPGTPGRAPAWRAPSAAAQSAPDPVDPAAARPAVRTRARPAAAPGRVPSAADAPEWHDEPTELRLAPATARGQRARAATPVRGGAEPLTRPRYPPAPRGSAPASQQLSFDEQPPASDE